MGRVRQHFWSNGSPCKCPEAKCVTLQSTTDQRVRWEMENCSTQNIFVCVKEQQNVNDTVIKGKKS